MSESELRPFLLKQPDGDEVERSIELLDKVLSEFEDPESLPHIEPDSPSQGHQSEDDGYMSMNGKKASALNANENDVITPKNKKIYNETTKLRNDILNGVDFTEAIPSQTTLPKARPSNVIPSKYASLPCSTPHRLASSNSGEEYLMGSGHTVLGIGISAVHDAVLRGVARIPESIVNEHPVTIYPGRASPAKKVPPRTLPGLIDRHRDVCRKSVDSSQELPIFNDNFDNLIKLDSNESLDIDEQSKITIVNSPIAITSTINKIIFNNNVIIEPCTSQNDRKSLITDDDFSDDSLEDTSLPPPPIPQPLVPPTTSLSAPVTPNKRGSIAWEININESNETKPFKTVTKLIGSNVTGSQNSVASTPCNSITSTDHTCSSDWPDPPEQPICSTEDEAGSLYTDSEDVIPLKPTTVPNGTYVIRKGRKDRAHLFDLEAFAAAVVPTEPDKESLDIEETDEEESPPPPPIITPNYRHSIDLALPSPAQHSIHSPRSRLSLNLHLPNSDNNSECWPTNISKLNNTNEFVISPRQSEYKLFCSKLDGLQVNNRNSNNPISSNEIDSIANCNSPIKSKSSEELNVPLMRVASLPTITAPPPPPPPCSGDVMSTPRRELAPPIEEDEELDSESQRVAPLRQIENNISALLRGDIPVARVGDIAPPRRPVGFRAGVHKSESAKEMLLSQNIFGPLPPSPPSSSPDETDGFPPLPPSPLESGADKFDEIIISDAHGYKTPSLNRTNRYRDSMEHQAPAIPAHRCTPTLNSLKTRSMDAGFTKCYKNNNNSMSPHAPGTLPQELTGSSNSRRRIMSGAFPKRSAQSPREERRLQTSCSLPETPIFARGCDVPRTPHRRIQEMPSGGGGSRTAPRPMNGLNSSIVGIAGSTLNGRQPRCINQALASSEMLRMTGGPARGWYPKQRHNRPASTENLDRINVQSTVRAWDTGTSNRKPLTLPPNLSPNFFNKSPREALRRVTSLLIRKGSNGKEPNKKEKDNVATTLHRSIDSGTTHQNNTHKKKGFFKSFWKKSKHYSLEQ